MLKDRIIVCPALVILAAETTSTQTSQPTSLTIYLTPLSVHRRLDPIYHSPAASPKVNVTCTLPLTLHESSLASGGTLYRVSRQAGPIRATMQKAPRGAGDTRIRQGPRWEVMPASLLQDIHASDQAMYPAPELTLDVLKAWLAGCPELSICFRYGNEELRHSRKVLALSSPSLHGSIIVLPLREASWKRLLKNEIKEHDVDAGMFPPLRPGTGAAGKDAGGEVVEVGLHVFHIEKSQGFRDIWRRTSFTVMALEEVRRRVSANYPWWRIIGSSGQLHKSCCERNASTTSSLREAPPENRLLYGIWRTNHRSEVPE